MIVPKGTKGSQTASEIIFPSWGADVFEQLYPAYKRAVEKGPYEWAIGMLWIGKRSS